MVVAAAATVQSTWLVKKSEFHIYENGVQTKRPTNQRRCVSSPTGEVLAAAVNPIRLEKSKLFDNQKGFRPTDQPIGLALSALHCAPSRLPHS